MAFRDQGWLLRRALSFREEIPINSMKLSEHSWNNNDLINGNVDALTGYSTTDVGTTFKI